MLSRLGFTGQGRTACPQALATNTMVGRACGGRSKGHQQDQVGRTIGRANGIKANGPVVTSRPFPAGSPCYDSLRAVELRLTQGNGRADTASSQWMEGHIGLRVSNVVAALPQQE